MHDIPFAELVRRPPRATRGARHRKQHACVRPDNLDPARARACARKALRNGTRKGGDRAGFWGVRRRTRYWPHAPSHPGVNNMQRMAAHAAELDSDRAWGRNLRPGPLWAVLNECQPA